MSHNYKQIEYSDPSSQKEGRVFKFKKYLDFLTNLNLRLKNDISYSNHDSSKKKKDSDFNSHNSLEEAIGQLSIQKPLPKATNNKMLEESKRSRLKLQDCGGDGIDIPVFLSGNTDHFITWSKRKNKKELKDNIFINLSVSARVKEKDLREFIIKSIEEVAEKYVFNKVILCEISTDTQLYIEFSYLEIQYLLRCSFVDFFRRITFYFAEQYSGLVYGYGGPIHDIQYLDKNAICYCYKN